MRRNRRQRNTPSARRDEAAGPETEMTVTGIGAQGDGIACGPAGRVFVPLSVPGDRVRVRLPAGGGEDRAAALIEVLSPGPGRGDPPCPAFGRCGGCRLQHLSDDAYARWKVERLTAALTRAGLSDYRLLPLVRTPPFARRRANFAAMRRAGGGTEVRLGFTVRSGHEIVDLDVCHVLDPRILAVLPDLRRFLARFLPPRQRTTVAVAVLDGGLDVVIEWPTTPALDVLEGMSGLAGEADLARLCWRSSAEALPEPVVQRRPVGAAFGGVFVGVPPGAFLQASREGEAALIAAVGDACRPARRIADLFAGIGTFAVPLAAEGARVHAVDADGVALRALAAARPDITTETRNLLARPLSPAELRRFDAVVFDPPRAGASAQARELARSEVPLVVAVSCNPDSFARDATTLGAGGYRLEGVLPVDQFLWSQHLELVALFGR